MELFGSAAIVIIFGAVVLDLIIGDPRWLPHPVAGIGKLISFLDRRLNAGSDRMKKIKGIMLTTGVVLFVFTVTAVVVYMMYQIHMLAGLAAEMVLVSTTIAIKSLKEAAMGIAVPLSRGNLPEARRQLSMIVGRDTEQLSEGEIVRGTVETVAENTTDGITAPLFWAFIGGAPLAMAYRAVNTLDSMVGYKNETYIRFGWASAKLDDAANWLPARLTALTIWLGSFFIKGFFDRKAWVVTRRDAPKHPSPNAGWTEAMTAALMSVQLGGRNTYGGQESAEARLGDPLVPLHVRHIKKAVVYMHGGWIVFAVLLVLVWLLFSLF